MTAILGLVVVEIVQTKGIHREKTLATNVPVARVTKAGWMIENGHAYVLSIDLGGVIDPVRRLSPAALLALAADSVHHAAAVLVRKRLGQPNAERSFLR